VPEKHLRIALAGNPNSGKTTIFNALTGARQHVGNYPGVTVEHKQGTCTLDGRRILVTDLPGTYSLTAHSPDEVVARDFIINEPPDVVVDIVDAGNLERNLYLAVQFMELRVPLVLAFNMIDMAESRGMRFDYPQLEAMLGVRIIPTVGNKGRGIRELLKAAVEAAEHPQPPQRPSLRYGRDVVRELDTLEQMVAGEPALARYPARWVALKLIEGDDEVCDTVRKSAAAADAIVARAAESTARLEKIYHDSTEIIIAESRYGFISGVCERAVKSTVETRHDMSDQIDKVVTGPLLGIPIFLLLMLAMFYLVFRLGGPPMEWIEALFGWLGGQVENLLPPGHLRSLLTDGIIAGVGGVLVFVPNIVLLFLAISFLEDSGYMARAAFIMDPIMSRIGLHGKSFIPLMLGFGCSVPAIMATRTLDNRRDRFVTILVAPLMSCGARLPVYILLAGAFFPKEAAGYVIFSLYVLGVAVAVVMARLFRKFLLPGPATPFVMELPPYRLPTLRGMLIHVWERTRLYVRKAATVILAFSVLIWALSTFPRNAALERDYEARLVSAQGDEAQALRSELLLQRQQYSFAGRFGRIMVPVLQPAGLGDWRLGTALFAGLGAKEVVVSTLGTLFSLSDADEESAQLRTALREHLSPLQAYAFMVFVLLYIPCIATVVIIKKETASWRWPLFAVGYTTALAWVASTIVFQLGMLLGLG